MTEKEIKKYLLKNNWKICKKTKKWAAPYYLHLFQNLNLKEALIVEKSIKH